MQQLNVTQTISVQLICYRLKYYRPCYRVSCGITKVTVKYTLKSVSISLKMQIW